MTRKTSPHPGTSGARARWGGSRYNRRTLGGVLRRARVVALAAGALVAVGTFVVAIATAGPSQGAAGGNGTVGAPNWVRLASTSPADILAAVRATRAYQDVYHAPQTLPGEALRIGTLGTPVLVRAYRPAPGMEDVWVVPVLAPASSGATRAGQVVMLLDFAFDRSHQRLRAMSFAGPFVPGDPEYGQPFPRTSARQALATFVLRRGGALSTATLGAAQAELVYFPANLNRLNDPQRPLTWTAGGQFPDLAVWRITLPGGADTIIGLDGNPYAPAQLPLAANAAPASH